MFKRENPTGICWQCRDEPAKYQQLIPTTEAERQQLEKLHKSDVHPQPFIFVEMNGQLFMVGSQVGANCVTAFQEEGPNELFLPLNP